MISQLLNETKPMMGATMGNDYFSSMSRQMVTLGVAALDWVFDRIERRRERLELARFSDRELKDIGLARHEIERVFVPASGKRV